MIVDKIVGWILILMLICMSIHYINININLNLERNSEFFNILFILGICAGIFTVCRSIYRDLIR